MDVSSLRQRYDSLKGSPERANMEAHCQEVAEYVSPRKIDFVGMRSPGDKRMQRVQDPTGIFSNELLAAGLHGMATNPAAKWFTLRMITGQDFGSDGELIDLNENADVRRFLSHVEDVMWSRLYEPGTNFTTALHETYLDLGAFGTAILYIGQRDGGGLLFESRSLAECVIAENIDGRVDTVFRRSTYTVRQMMQMVQSGDWRSVSGRVKNLYDAKKYDDPVHVIHAVLPRSERDASKRDSKNMPFASVYFEHDGEHVLSESGYPEFPYLCPRWSKYSSEVYGRSPAMTALPDIKMLQSMMLVFLKTAQKNADPVTWINDDGQMSQVRQVPGGINYLRGNPNDRIMLQPTSPQGLQAVATAMDGIRARIRTAFFTDEMQFVTDKQMTATEVMARTQERMRLLGPLMGRLESELLGPMVARVFGILERMSVLPVAPEMLKDKDFTVEYVSPIATAQRQQAASGIMQVYQLLAPLGPEAAMQVMMKRVNPEKLVDWAWSLFNCDPDLLNDEAAQEQAGQMQNAMQAIQMGQPMAEIAHKGAGAMKQLADAQAGGGIDLNQAMSAYAGAVKSNPQAMSEAQAMMNGQQPQQ